MVHARGLPVCSLRALTLIFLFTCALAIATPLFGQATVPEALRSPTMPGPNTWSPPISPVNNVPNPGSTWSPPPNYSSYSGTSGSFAPSNSGVGSILNAPNGNMVPSIEQRQWYVNNTPQLQSLDPGLKQAIVYGGAGSGLLNGYYLPNGAVNSFYQNPNWFLPTTWSSSTMNWQGVQPNGFLPSTAGAIYNPSAFSTPYNPSSFATSSSSFSTYRAPNYRPPPSYQPPTHYSQPATYPRPYTTQQQPLREIGRSPGPSETDIKRVVEARERALSLHEAAGDKVALAADHADLARLFVQLSKPEQALLHIGLAEQAGTAIGDSRLQAELLQTKAAAYLSTGELEQSIHAYQEAMKVLREELNDKKGQAEVYTSTGWVFQSLGDTQHALSCYEAALTLFIDLKDSDGQVRVRLGIGSIYQSLGETDRALEQYNKALPGASKDQRVRILLSIAEMDQLQNPSKALATYEKALFHQFEITYGDNAREAVIMAGIGRCHMALGNYSYASQYFEKALVRMREAGNAAGEAGVLASMGELKYWTAVRSPNVDPKRQFSEALKHYDEALSLMRGVGDRIGEIGVLTNTGLVYDAWQKPHQALSYYRKALEKMEELQRLARLEEFRVDLGSQATSLYQRAILLEISLHHGPEAFELSERARARTFLDQLGNSRIGTANHLPAEFALREEELRRENISLQRQLGQELAKPGPDVDPERVGSLQSRMSTVQRQYEDLLLEAKIANPEYSSFLSISPLTLQGAQQQLGPDLTVVSYFITPEMTLAFTLSKDSFHVTKLHLTGLQLYVAVTTLLDFSGEADPPGLRLLYKSLIAPVKPHLKTSMLAVVPHGFLQNLPFAALTPDGTHYLSDSYSLISLPSVSVLPYVRARTKPSGDHILVLANDREEGLPRLLHASGEARAVASLFGPESHLDDSATASLLKDAGNYDIVHMIAHIERNDKNPQFSRIITGPGKRNEGPLELHQVFNLDLKKTGLVVLSGCQSQSGRQSRGDDVIAFSRAFMYAGSPSVIASLWSVDDEATEQFMIAFYTHLKQGLGKAEALRTAQAEVRQKYPHPYYWAGFVLTGDPGKPGAFNLLASSK